MAKNLLEIAKEITNLLLLSNIDTKYIIETVNEFYRCECDTSVILDDGLRQVVSDILNIVHDVHVDEMNIVSGHVQELLKDH
jgi:hypothetical protein